MKKRLIGLILIISTVLISSVSVYADGNPPPFPRPPHSNSPHSFSVDLNEAE